MKTIPIPAPLPGEHLATTSPRMQPDTDNDRWRLRLNFWAGRSLTADALELEQDHRSERLTARGRLASPGLLGGLDVALEGPDAPQGELARAGYFLHVQPGAGFLANGDDIVIPRPLRVPLDTLAVDYVRVGRANHQPPFEPAPAGSRSGVTIDTGDRIVLVDRQPADSLPWAAVLVVCPVEFGVLANTDPLDPCEVDPSQDPFADERRVDASMLRLCELPAAWREFPELGDNTDPRWRNRLAHVVLSQEARGSARQILRRRAGNPADRRWGTILEPEELLPWEYVGVPIALLSAERLAAEAPLGFFLDRAAVARTGGTARPRTRPALALDTDDDDATRPPGNGTPSNWRARVDQFAAHLGSFAAADAAAIAELSSRFQFLPPAGFLPRGALDFLTSAQAVALPLATGQVPDRAGISHFFPPTLSVDAVPVAVEDLDAALASSAPLGPYDLENANNEPVRVLVPVPQRIFEPELLVVETEDPVFAETVDRFVAARQGWRERRDFVRVRRDALLALANGPAPDTNPSADPGQLEPEPVEATGSLGFIRALVAPLATTGPWDLTVDVTSDAASQADDRLFVVLRLDEESAPSRIEARWIINGQEVRFLWAPPFPAPPSQTGTDGQPAASSLWLRLSVPTASLGASVGVVTRFTLHVEDGRVAFASMGRTIRNADGESDNVLWRADRDPGPTFVGGDWTAATGDQLLAPFEDQFEPVFADGRTRAEHVADIEDALNPPAATPRPTPPTQALLSVATIGLTKAIAQLDAEASEADDFIDAHFTRAQINLYRIRKLMLGQTAAQKLLVNPAIAAIAEQETATASAEQLQTFIAAARQRPVTVKDVTDAATGPARTRMFGAFALNVSPIAAFNVSPITAFTPVNPVVSPISAFTPVSPVFRTVDAEAPAAKTPRFDVTRTTVSIDVRAAQLQDVVGERPETGPTLPPRGLSIGQRFKEPPATQNLSYARSDLNDLLSQLPALRLPLVGEDVKSLTGQDVKLLALQGRVPGAAGATPETIRQSAITTLLTFTPPDADTDEAEVTLAALDFTEIKSAILRTIERVVQQRRSVIQKGLTDAGLIAAQADAADGRVLVIEGRLAEARQDVGVARALRQEEQQRIAASNDRRDAVIRDEVTFLAFVRPRTVDLVRRTSQYWQLEAFDTPATVPACLQRHGEPPPALNAYLDLFNSSPVRWFTALEPLLARLDTPQKVITLIETSRQSAITFKTLNPAAGVKTASQAVQLTLLGAHRMISTVRQRTAVIDIPDIRSQRWQDVQRDAREHATVGDLVAGRFGARDVSSAASGELERIAQVATCLHAEFSAIAPAIRLLWVERFSQFDKPALLRDLTVLPQYGQLDRPTRRRLQEFADWLFGRVTPLEGDAVNLMNDLIRLCLLLASHAPVNQIIAGHVPRPTPIRPGIRIPIRPLNPDLVRVGMQFQVWQASTVVAHGLVEDLVRGEVTGNVQGVGTQTTTIDPSMRVQFVPAALKMTFR